MKSQSAAIPIPMRLHSVALRFRHPLASSLAYSFLRLGGSWQRRTLTRGKLGSTVFSAEERVTDAGGRDARMARLEAVLFLAREPLHARKLAKFAKLVDGTEANTLIQRLNRLYDGMGRAFRVENVAGGWQYRTREKFGPWVRRLRHVTPEVRLSAPSMETLVVVAYRQPVVRAEIEGVRGVNCGEVLRQLMEKDLVRVAGRSNDLGRPFYYATTRKFLQVFGLRDLSELPRVDLFRGNLNGQEKTESTRNLAEGDTDVAVTEFGKRDEVEAKSWTPGVVASQVAARAKEEEEEEEWVDDEEELDDDEEDDEEDDWDDDEEDDDEDWEDDDDEEEVEVEKGKEKEKEKEKEKVVGVEELDDEEEEEWEEVDDDEEELEDEEDDEEEWEDDDEEEEEEEAWEEDE